MYFAPKVIEEFKGEHRYLSNFFDYSFSFHGRMFASSEHAFQACKTFDPEEQKIVQEARSPREAKAAGQLVTLRPDWREVRDQLMYLVVKEKFRQSPALNARLQETHGVYLMEGNEWGDTYWGMVWHPLMEEWVGQNKLGLILMQVREELK